MKIILDSVPHERYNIIVNYASSQTYRTEGSEKTRQLIRVIRCEPNGEMPPKYNNVEIEVEDTTGHKSVEDYNRAVRKSTQGLLRIIMTSYSYH